MSGQEHSSSVEQPIGVGALAVAAATADATQAQAMGESYPEPHRLSGRDAGDIDAMAAIRERFGTTQQQPPEEFQVCQGCNNTFSVTKGEIHFGPDPYAEEIHDDHTEVWECNLCREESALDI